MAHGRWAWIIWYLYCLIMSCDVIKTSCQCWNMEPIYICMYIDKSVYNNNQYFIQSSLVFTHGILLPAQATHGDLCYTPLELNAWRYHLSLERVQSRSLYIRMAKWGCLRLSQHAIRKYSGHIGSMVTSDDRGSRIVNHHNFTVT